MSDTKSNLPPFSEIYLGFLIQYREHDNMWSIQRSVSTTQLYPSLVKARESIDRLQKQEKKTFRRHTALLALRYGECEFQKVEVTSYVAKQDFRGHNELHAWCKLEDGRRLCEPVSELREDCPANTRRCEVMLTLETEVEILQNKHRALVKELDTYKKRSASDVFPNSDAPLDLLPFLS